MNDATHSIYVGTRRLGSSTGTGQDQRTNMGWADTSISGFRMRRGRVSTSNR